jgi:hypothetical protein
MDRLRRAWPVALGLFVLAGATGVLYRLGLTYGWTAGLDLVNIRHAHSHLMYFGWVTPLLFALVAAHLPTLTGRALPRSMRGVLIACFGAALVSYPLFLAFGYTPVALGSARMPLAVIGSSLNIVGWYGFVWIYARMTRGVPRTAPLVLWDIALTFLVLATLGAWGLALLKPLGIESATWASALTHIFLDLFSEGWLVLGVLGLAYAALDAPPRWSARGVHWSLYLLLVGLPVTFALGMARSLVPPGLMTVARLGSVAVGLGLLVQAVLLGRRLTRAERWLWGVPLALLAMKALAQLGAGILPDVWWGSQHGLRIFYLHLMLLGVVSLGLVAAATRVWGEDATRGRSLFYGAVLLLLASLVPLTPLWPVAWVGRWAYVLAVAIAPLPVGAALVMLWHGARRSPPRSPSTTQCSITAVGTQQATPEAIPV